MFHSSIFTLTNGQIACSQLRLMISNFFFFFTNAIFLHRLKILHEKTSILNFASKEKYTEGDYAIMLWSRIFEAVFNDNEQNLFCKWGDTVPEGSSLEKKRAKMRMVQQLAIKLI
ncbi:unnamed protein product [Rhizopus stolonifer]